MHVLHTIPTAALGITPIPRRPQRALFILVIAPVFIRFGPAFGVGDAERAAQLVGERHGAEKTGVFEPVEVGQVAKTVEAKTVQEGLWW